MPLISRFSFSIPFFGHSHTNAHEQKNSIANSTNVDKKTGDVKVGHEFSLKRIFLQCCSKFSPRSCSPNNSLATKTEPLQEIDVTHYEYSKTSITTQAVKTTKRSEKHLERHTLYKKVDKGLQEAIHFCKKREEKLGAVKDNQIFLDHEIFFHQEDIPSLEDIKPVIRYYVKHRNEWKGPQHITGPKQKDNTDKPWPCSIVYDEGKGYLLFPLKIGEGGKKTIFLAIDLQTGENVAISQIKSDLNVDFNTISLPSYIMNRLGPHFPKNNDGGLLPLKQIIDIVNGNERTQFVVQKLCKDGNLFTLLSSGAKLTDKEKKTYMDDISKAVQLLHKHSFFHKDLKIENVCLDDGHAYLIDFDYTSSKRDSFPKEGEKTETYGSFPYLPPEAILAGDYDEKSEVWALGLIFYTLLSGNQPRVVQELESKGPDFKYSAARFNVWNPWRTKPADTQGAKLVEKMLTTEPEQRCSLATVREELHKIPSSHLSFEHSNPFPEQKSNSV